MPPATPAVEQGLAGAAGDCSPLVPRGVDARRLWVSGYVDFYASAVSPDGRYVTEIDWTTGDLAIRDLGTGLLHRLTDKGSWERSGDYAHNARFSWDGRPARLREVRRGHERLRDPRA